MKPDGELLKRRDLSPFQVSPHVTVFEGLQLLARYGVGVMLVMQDETCHAIPHNTCVVGPGCENSN